MPLGHDEILNSSDKEDSTIFGPFPEEPEGHTDFYIMC
jgi:hypothetical protein